MKKILLLFTFLLVMVSLAYADTTLTDCQDINNSGTYNLTGQLDLDSKPSGTTCFDINVDNVLIDCDNNSVIAGNQETFVLFDITNLDNVTITNCRFYDNTVLLKVDSSDNIKLIDNLIISDEKTYAVDLYGSFDVPVKVYNNTFGDSVVVVHLDHDNTDSNDIIIKNNNIGISIDGEYIYAEIDNYNPLGSLDKGYVYGITNWYNNPESCIDRAEDLICDTFYGSGTYIDETPVACENQWLGETESCSYSTSLYGSGDLARAIFDGTVTFILGIVGLIVIVVLGVMLYIFRGMFDINKFFKK